MSDQTPKTSLLHSAILAIGLIAASGVHAWWTKPATVQPAPVVVSQPVQVRTPAIDPVRTLATKDDIGLSDADKDAAIKFASIGDGRYVLYSTPEGSKAVLKQIIVSTIGDTVKPIDPKPVDPQPDVKPVEPVTTKPTAAFYVYEKDDTAVPNYVKTGLSKVNASGVEATLLEEDTKDGNNQVPARFQVPLAEAKKAGLPVFVVMSNGQFLRAVKPKSESEMLEAVK